MIFLRFLAAAVSGAAFVAAFPPYDLGSLAWVALVPLLLAAGRRPPREAFWLGYVWGIVGLGGVLSWFTAFGAVVWMLGAVLLGVFPALALGAAAWIGGGGEGRFDALRLAVLWTAIEYLRGLGPLGFPWALLGESQHRAVVVSQIASVAGVHGVSFLVALVNASLACLILRQQVLRSLLVAALAVAAAVLWGTAALRAPAIPPDGRTFAAAIVQPDYAIRLRWDPERAARDLDVLGRLTHEAATMGAQAVGAHGPVLVVWPETASPTDVPGDPATLARLRSWVRRDHISLIASSLEGGLTNSAFSVAPGGMLLGRYDKVHLVPFAEFGEQAGRDSGLLRTPVGDVGVAICFESTFPEVARRSVMAGAVLLTVLTNDAWFDGPLAPTQHAAIAPFRAIEEGRYLLRAANSGPSMIIDPHGRVIGALPLGARGVVAARVAPRRGLTPYARYGYLFGWATVLGGVLLVLPRAFAPRAAQSGSPGLARLLTVSTLPLAALGVAARFSTPAAGPVVPLPVLAVLVTTALLSRGRSRQDLGLRAAGFVPALLTGLAVVAGLTVVAVRALTAHGAAPQPLVPPGGWVLGGAAQVLVVGMTFEWWLRGLVFADAAAWQGLTVAILWSAVLGMAAGIPRGAEAMVWGLLSGLIFGLIRARWSQVPALAVAHGAGNIALGFLLSPW